MGLHGNSPTCCSSLLTVFPLSLYVFMFPCQCAHLDGSSPWCEVPTAPLSLKGSLLWCGSPSKSSCPHSVVPLAPHSCHSCTKASVLMAMGCPHHGQVMATGQAGQPTAPLPTLTHGCAAPSCSASHSWKVVRDKLLGKKKAKGKKAVNPCSYITR